MSKRLILAINPGSTSTKIAVYDNIQEVFSQTLRHSSEELSLFHCVFEQYEFRYQLIKEVLENHSIPLNDLTAVVGRGGMLRPIKSGTYTVNEKMLKDLKDCVRGEHASNLGAVIADCIAKEAGISAYIVDPVAVDEMSSLARISGLKGINRDSLFHALNQKAVAKRYAKSINQHYESLNLIVAHLGGGISVGAHQKGQVIDVNNALDGDGPFSPERSGGLPLGPLYKLCYSGEYTLSDIKRMNYGAGGLVSYLGTNNGLEVARKIEQNDEYAKEILEAMCYQVSQEIAKHFATLKGEVDAILITGGLAYNHLIIEWIKERVGFMCDVTIYPGEDEMQALVEGTLRVLDHEELPKIY